MPNVGLNAISEFKSVLMYRHCLMSQFSQMKFGVYKQQEKSRLQGGMCVVQ